MHTKNTNTNYTFALAVVGMLFFMIGFALGINGLLIPYLQKAFALSSAESYLVLTATFGAFALLGYPAGMLLKKVGYKKSMATAFLFFAVGLYLFVPSARHASFPLFLLASFVSGTGNTILQAAVNPYVTICGPIESAARRISVMGILNKSGWAVAPLFLALFLDLSQSTVSLADLCLPFYIIAGIFVVLGVFTLLVPLPEISAEGENEGSAPATAEEARIIEFAAAKRSVLGFPHLLLGMLLLFLYVGVETIALASPVDYAATIGLKNPQTYGMYTVIAMVAGYILGVALIPRYVSQHRALVFCAMTGIVFSLLAVTVPEEYSIWFVAALGFSNSLIWGPAWPLALANLGKFTKAGSSLLVMAIVGGAVLPLVFGWLIDVLGSMQQAYWICVPFYVYALYYALWGHKAGLGKLHEKC